MVDEDEYEDEDEDEDDDEEYEDEYENLELDVTAIEMLGRANVLHVKIGEGAAAIVIEPPIHNGSPFGFGVLTVASARDAEAIVKAIFS